MMENVFPEAEHIYFNSTKENFAEVVSTFSAGNYRSSVVMLYSVVVCDLLLKLQELSDTDNDKKAAEILRKREESKKNSKSKSSWEWELINEVYNRTRFLDNAAFTNLESLYRYRNMCAHPETNDFYQLYRPSRVTTIALIENSLKTVLVRPPIYINNVFDSLTDDLASRKEIFQDRDHDDRMKTFIDNRYYNKMDIQMKLKIGKSFWKICFIIPDTDENCKANRTINRLALELLTEEIYQDFKKQITADNRNYGVGNDEVLQFQLIRYLAKFPDIYKLLEEDVQYRIRALTNKSNKALAISWFLYNDMTEVLDKIDCRQDIDENELDFIFEEFEKAGHKKEVLDFFVRYFGQSTTFDTANERYDFCIKGYLSGMSTVQLRSLVESISDNYQLHGRRNAPFDNAEIACEIDRREDGFDYSLYKKFRVDEETLRQKKSKEYLNLDDLELDESDFDVLFS